RQSGNWLHRGRACFETRPRALLSMRELVDGITGIAHPEEAAERLSRRTHGADPANRQFPDSLIYAEDALYQMLLLRLNHKLALLARGRARPAIHGPRQASCQL